MKIAQHFFMLQRRGFGFQNAILCTPWFTTFARVTNGILVIASLALANVALAQEHTTWTQNWPKTDFTQTNINLTEIVDSGIPKDGIPAISRPRFVSVKKARKWIDDREPVLVVEIDNKARAYPLQILLYHQIVNDTFRNKPILITFCPLCNNGLVLNRRVDGKTLTFGTSGLLRNSGLVMFDRQTESLWQQFTGTAIAGQYVTKQLSLDYPTQLIAFSQFAQRHPKGRVLSRDTGFNRKYGLNPFQGYDSIDNNPLLFQDETDPRLPAMERVLNVRINESLKLYPFTSVKSSGVINDVVDGRPVVVMSGLAYASPLDQTDIHNSTSVPTASGFDRTINNNTVLKFTSINGKIIDTETRSQWNAFGEAIAGELKGVNLKRVDVGVNFAFASLAFMPDAAIYRNQ